MLILTPVKRGVGQGQYEKFFPDLPARKEKIGYPALVTDAPSPEIQVYREERHWVCRGRLQGTCPCPTPWLSGRSGMGRAGV